MQDEVTSGTKAAPQLRLFTGNQIGIVASGFNQSTAPHHDVAAKVLGDTGKIYPVEVEHTVVKGTFRMEFPAMPPDSRYARIGLKGYNRGLWEPRIENSIPIQEKNIFTVSPAPTRIATASSCLALSTQNNYLGVRSPGVFGTSIGRCGININNFYLRRTIKFADRLQATGQPCALIPANDHYGQCRS